MGDEPSVNKDEDEPSDKSKKTATITYIIIGAAIFWIILALIDWRFVNEHTERIRFITVNSLSLFVVVIIAIQSVIYRREWRVMQRGLEQTDKIIEAMRGQLKAVKWQGELMKLQISFMKLQSQSLVQHTDLMIASIEDNRKLIQQNERAVKAAEDSAKVAKDALYVGEAPYFGIKRMLLTGFNKDTPNLRLEIIIANGGKTPAWHVHVMPWVAIGNAPETADRWYFLTTSNHIGYAFFSAGTEKELVFWTPEFRVTEQILERIDREKLKVFIDGTIHYNDMRREPLFYNFVALFDPDSGEITDFTVGKEAT